MKELPVIFHGNFEYIGLLILQSSGWESGHSTLYCPYIDIHQGVTNDMFVILFDGDPTVHMLRR